MSEPATTKTASVAPSTGQTIASERLHHADDKEAVWAQQRQARAPQTSLVNDKVLLSDAAKLDRIEKRLADLDRTPQEYIRALRDYHHSLIPGSRLRDGACSQLQAQYLNEGKAATPEEAHRLAEKTLHERFAVLGTLVEKLVRELKEHPEMGKESMKRFLAKHKDDPDFADAIKLIGQARAHHRALRQAYIAPYVSRIGAPALASSRVSQPAATFSFTGQTKAPVVASARSEAQPIARQPEPVSVLASEKPKGTVETIIKANNEITEARAEKEKHDHAAAQQQDEEDLRKHREKEARELLMKYQSHLHPDARVGSTILTPDFKYMSEADVNAYLQRLRDREAALGQNGTREPLEFDTEIAGPAKLKS